MADDIDFFNVYIMGSAESLFMFYFFVRILKKRARLPFYFLFVACEAAVIHFVMADTIVVLGVLVLLLAACGVLICHAGVSASFLYAALVVEMMQLCYGMVKSLSSLLYPLVMASFPQMPGLVWMLASELAALLLFSICCHMVDRHFSCYTALEIQYMFLVFIPVLMIFIMDEYINTIVYGMQIIQGGEMAKYIINHGQMFLLQFLGTASLFCILFAYKKLLQSFQLRTELSLLEQKEHSLNQYVEEAKSRYEKTKSFRHDIRNHIAVVKELLQGGKMEQALHYIGEMEDIAEELFIPCSTNNPVVDILVGNKLGIANNMGIAVSCSLLLPYPCGLRDIDICIVLANALDNAIHACKNMGADTDKYIHISGRIQGDLLMIEVENSCQGKGVFRKGTGLSNIKTVTEKYDGAMSVKTQGEVFVLHVLLIIPQHTEAVHNK